MAKLGSSSRRPLLQGMMLLALLLASIQAGPVMAQVEQFAGKAKEFAGKTKEFLGHVAEMGGKNGEEYVHGEAEKSAKTVLTRCKQGWERFCKGGKMGLRVHRYLCKAQGWMDKQNSGGASGTPYFVEFIGGDLLSSVPTLSCSVTSNRVVPCCSAAPQVQATLFPSRYPPATMSVRITGIRVGQEEVRVPPPAYTNLSNLESSLSAAVIRQVKALNHPWTKPISTAADKLCYAAAALSSPLPLPRIAILLGSDNGGVMQTTELSVDATGTVWYRESFMLCLGIRTTVELIPGTP